MIRLSGLLPILLYYEAVARAVIDIYSCPFVISEFKFKDEEIGIILTEVIHHDVFKASVKQLAWMPNGQFS